MKNEKVAVLNNAEAGIYHELLRVRNQWEFAERFAKEHGYHCAGAIADKTREHYETLKQFVVNAWGVDPDFIEEFLNGEYIVIPEESLDIRGLK